MKLIDAKNNLKPYIGTPFGQIFMPLPQNMTTNKGHAGQYIEKLLDLPATNALNDFEDGELKTNKADELGDPLETMAITQISTIVDSLLGEPPVKFEESNLYKKIDRLLYLPICKVKPKGNKLDHKDWFIVSTHFVDLSEQKWQGLRNQLELDYYKICKNLRQQVETDGKIKTTNGKFIQIRTKAPKPPYQPIYSNIYQKNISDKNRAFYFKKEFMRYVRENDQ